MVSGVRFKWYYARVRPCARTLVCSLSISSATNSLQPIPFLSINPSSQTFEAFGTRTQTQRIMAAWICRGLRRRILVANTDVHRLGELQV
ncbi:hypothetical protein BD410DRAFT_796694 [Rickenella mellea]|uniref:Uncharacterized protein n=1 Tax=Rickenella mellea TaxID=50990 RepID=A0A4Y7PIL5_9AGAM|nr:hypothetical protein BD410DRAFT_796694 [Rickenella mellea]